MRFSKILLVCFALVLFAGLSAHQTCARGAAGTLTEPVVESAAGSAVLSASFMADGGKPLPPPIMADGGKPLPPPSGAPIELGTAS